MILCIAEKPSVARDIAKVLGANTSKQGYMEGGGYIVSWTYGHLCTLKEPHDYGAHLKSWDTYLLPIIPEKFGIKLIDSPSVKKQFEVLCTLIQNATEVVNCGDAGQEGELIQRWVLQKARCKVPIKRLWISSLTKEAIKKGFENLQDSEKYDALYQAGQARAIGDWLLGINATRLYTKKFGQGKSLLSIGRVQTPTLAMIVERYKEIQAFDSTIYFELKTLYRGVEFLAQIERLTSKEKAEKGKEYLRQKPLEIVDFERKPTLEHAPRLFDLTSLQVEANRRWGYSAEKTLKLIQSLYEKKHTTYPRVDTTYLPEAMYEQMPELLASLTPYRKWVEGLPEGPLAKSPQVFDDKKVTDHHAIIPTNQLPSSSLGTEEKLVYDLVVRRLIAVFYPPSKISVTTALARVGTIDFKATGRETLELGWRVVYSQDNKPTKSDEESKEKQLPQMQKAEHGSHEPFIHQGKTSPPKYFTEASLLRSMETAGKLVEDEALREAMKASGIGRPSTRANIIETLFKRGYIERKKKNILPTATGIALVDTIENELLKSPELTGAWEFKLREIEKGNYRPEQFRKELSGMVSELVREVLSKKATVIQLPVDPKALASEEKPKEKHQASPPLCPRCKVALREGKTALGCPNYQTCGFKIDFVQWGKKLSLTQLYQLVDKGKTGRLKGFDGTFEGKTQGVVVLSDSGDTTLK